MQTDTDPQGQNPRTDADSKFWDPHISTCSTLARCLLDRVNGVLVYAIYHDGVESCMIQNTQNLPPFLMKNSNNSP